MGLLQRDEKFFEGIAFNLGDGLLALDRGERIIFANMSAESITGYSSQELTSMDFDQIISRKEIMEAVGKRRNQEDIQKFHHCVTVKSGVKKYLSFHIAPCEIGEVVCFRDVTRAYKSEMALPTEAVKTEDDETKEMIGTSYLMMQIFSTIRKVASSDIPVLLIGETGTGKELTAQAIHERSARKSGPFIAINCGAIPEGLLESELFGYERGAFTGAHVQKKGKIEDAHGGTLFLDEIGELPLSLQVKLLRFLEDHRVGHLGGNKEIIVDERIISATNSDLKIASSASSFRADLYYRLHGVAITLPPLRERGDDVSLIARAFLKKFEKENSSMKIKGLTPDAMDAIKAYHWPGNIRELINRIRRAIVMTEDGWITAEGLELKVVETASKPKTLREATDAVERELILNALNKHHGNISIVARELGISRPNLYALIIKYNLSRNFTSP